ncbi:MAG: RNA polymerase sigma factor [Ferruginibacter sp.]
MDQLEIIEKLKRGDAGVFKQVVEQWQEKVFNTAINIVQNEADAEDITQEVFVTLYQRKETFRGDALLSTWLYRVTINKALDHEKKQNRKKRGGGLRSFFVSEEWQEPVHFEHPGALVENKEKAKALFIALKKIPDAQRIAFIMHKMEGKSFEEIAAITENTRMAVESLMARAKVNLRNVLKSWYEINMIK